MVQSLTLHVDPGVLMSATEPFLCLFVGTFQSSLNLDGFLKSGSLCSWPQVLVAQSSCLGSNLCPHPGCVMLAPLGSEMVVTFIAHRSLSFAPVASRLVVFLIAIPFVMAVGHYSRLGYSATVALLP